MLMEYAIFERFHGTPAAALPLFEQALRLRPDHVEAHVNYGAVLLDAGRAEEAAREFYFVLSKAPDHFWAKYLLGVASIKQNRPIEAFAAFEGALPLAPSDAMRNATVGFALQAAAQINDCVKARSMANLYPQALASAADDVRQFLKKCP
jgi:tetratricopeptide (TPR) repeat protein